MLGFLWVSETQISPTDFRLNFPRIFVPDDGSHYIIRCASSYVNAHVEQAKQMGRHA
jgi:hypothetical protein